VIPLPRWRNDRENRLRSDDLGSVHTQGTPLFALLQTVLGRRDSFRGPAYGSGQGGFASFLNRPLPPAAPRNEGKINARK